MLGTKKTLTLPGMDLWWGCGPPARLTPGENLSSFDVWKGPAFPLDALETGQQLSRTAYNGLDAVGALPLFSDSAIQSRLAFGLREP